MERDARIVTLIASCLLVNTTATFAERAGAPRQDVARVQAEATDQATMPATHGTKDSVIYVLNA